jgi:hypothetical protein
MTHSEELHKRAAVTLSRIELLTQSIKRHETYSPENELSIKQFKRLRQEMSNQLYQILAELGVDKPQLAAAA